MKMASMHWALYALVTLVAVGAAIILADKVLEKQAATE
jgi:hypothetical protein